MSKKVTITVDLESLKTHLEEMCDPDTGLESSSGYTPDDLDRVVSDVLRLDKNNKELGILIRDVIHVHVDVHNNR